MSGRRHTASVLVGVTLVAHPLVLAPAASGQLDLGPEELVQSGGVDIDVPGYSVPTFAFWDGDDRRDLIVGEGASTGRVRVYLNVGTEQDPQFAGFFYAQSGGGDLTVPGGS